MKSKKRLSINMVAALFIIMCLGFTIRPCQASIVYAVDGDYEGEVLGKDGEGENIDDNADEDILNENILNEDLLTKDYLSEELSREESFPEEYFLEESKSEDFLSEELLSDENEDNNNSEYVEKVDILPPLLAYSIEGYIEIFGHRFYKGNLLCLNVDTYDDSNASITIIVYREDIDEYGEIYTTEYSRHVLLGDNHKIWIPGIAYYEGIKVKAIDIWGNETCDEIYDSSIMFDSSSPRVEAVIKEADYKADDILYYKDYQIIDIDISEEEISDSGIKSAYISVNGDRYDLMSNVTRYDEINIEKALHVSYCLDMKQIKADDNMYDIYLYAEDNVGNISDADYKIFIDNIAPSVEKISADGKNISIGGDEYEYLSGNPVKLGISSHDNPGGSGIKEIKYYLDGNKEGAAIDSLQPGYLSISEDDYSELVVAPDYKGRLYLRLVDNVGNESELIETTPFITESETAFANHASVYIGLPDNEFVDVHNNPLYSGDISIQVKVKEDYAGIDEVLYEISVDGKVHEKGTLDISDGSRDVNLITSVDLCIPVELDANDISIAITLVGNVGYKMEKTMRFSIDKTAPVTYMNISSGINDAVYQDYYNTDVGIDIQITDMNFDENLVFLNINGARLDINSIRQGSYDESSTTYQYRLNLSSEGPISISLEMSDRAGNIGEARNLSFTIDKTAPKISVSYEDAEDIYYYNHSRKAYVNIEEENIDYSRINIDNRSTGIYDIENLNGISLSFNADGSYLYSISMTDKAGNTSETYFSSEFIIDKISPNINIDKIENGLSYNGVISGEVFISDKYLDVMSLTMNVYGQDTQYHNEWSYDSYAASDRREDEIKVDDKSDILCCLTENNDMTEYQLIMADIPYDREYDGHYNLDVSACDLAGNTYSSSVSYIVNRFGSTYSLGDNCQEINGQYIRSVDEINIYEINIDSLDYKEVDIIYNGISTKLEDEDYLYSYETNGIRYEYTYVIPGSAFTKDGNYRVVVSSVDAAGNRNISSSSDNGCAIGFFVDNTSPAISSINLTSGDIIEESSYQEEILIRDNGELEQINIFVDGTLTQEYSGEKISGDRYFVTINESNRKQNVMVKAIDKAGNEAVYELRDVLITSNIFISTMERKHVTIGIIIVILGIAGLSVFEICTKVNTYSKVK